MDRATELRDAVRRDDRARVSALLESAPELASVGNRRGLSLLVDARVRGHAAIVARLAAARRAAGDAPLNADELVALGEPVALERLLRADPAAVHRAAADGFLPVHRAAFLGETACVDVLLEQGADPARAAANASQLSAAGSADAGRRKLLAARLRARIA
ncbi:MAG: hypothetical protein R3F49_00610 [Planctomycetota bacterium]